MNNRVYTLLFLMFLTTGFGSLKVKDASMKPIAPQSTSVDIIALYKLADKFRDASYESLAIATRDTAKILGDSYLYKAVKGAALLGLLYQIGQYLKKHPTDDILIYAYTMLTGFATTVYWFMGDFGKSYTTTFSPWYEFAQTS